MTFPRLLLTLFATFGTGTDSLVAQDHTYRLTLIPSETVTIPVDTRRLGDELRYIEANLAAQRAALRPKPILTENEVLRLAEVAVRQHGYDLSGYTAKARFITARGMRTWFVDYNAAARNQKTRIVARIGDRTKSIQVNGPK